MMVTPSRNDSTKRNTAQLNNQRHVQALLVLLQMKHSFLQRDTGDVVKVNQPVMEPSSPAAWSAVSVINPPAP